MIAREIDAKQFLNDREIELMEHTLGIERAWDTHGYHYKRHGKQYIKSYRNYYQDSFNSDTIDTWKSLVNRGYAKTWTVNMDNRYPYFAVTDLGCSVLEKTRNYTIKYVN